MIKHPVSSGDTYYLYATYYGDEFNGRKTANGSDFNGNELTCAARGFPFDTYLEVQSLSTLKTVIVKVTDRPGKNVIDLTKKAFSEIDTLENGKTRVKVTVTSKPENIQPEQPKDEVKPVEETPKQESSATFFTLQLGAFTELESAKSFSGTLKIESYIFVVKDSKELYRVRSGRFNSKEEAEKFKIENCSNMEATIVEVTE